MEFWRTLILIVSILVNIYAILIVVRTFVAFFIHKQTNLTAFIYRVTEPALKIFRKLLRNKSGFDWSYVLVIIALAIIILLLMILSNSLK